MSNQTIRPDGTVVYRTKLMDFARATAFARCIEANANFQDVVLEQSTRAKTEQYLVTFRPASRARQCDMLDREQDARTDRAHTEGGDYVFWQDPDRGYLYWCYNPISGETYEVTIGSCSCPDYHYRCERAGIQCKHMAAWCDWSAAGRPERPIVQAA